MLCHETNFQAVSQSLPPVIHENLSLIRELDEAAQSLLSDIDRSIKRSRKGHNNEVDGSVAKKRKLADFIMEKKSRLAMSAYDLIDKHVRLIDEELNALDAAIEACNNEPGLSEPVTTAAASGIIASFGTKNTANEPLFCTCRRVAFGEMIACDNEDCLIEWFHFPCVGLTRLPRKGIMWYCPDCTATLTANRVA